MGGYDSGTEDDGLFKKKIIFRTTQGLTVPMKFDMELTIDEALKEWEIAVSLDPQNYEVLHNLGIAYYNKGEDIRAIEYWEKCLEVRPHDPEIHFKLGIAYYNLGKEDQAINLWEKASNLGHKKAKKRYKTCF